VVFKSFKQLVYIDTQHSHFVQNIVWELLELGKSICKLFRHYV
jgi:hypothetical protein